jgi:hypothetical protein
MVKCGVLFEVRNEFLNNIDTSFVLKGLRQYPGIRLEGLRITTQSSVRIAGVPAEI